MDSKQESNVPTHIDNELQEYEVFNQQEAAIKFKSLYETKYFVKAVGQKINFEELKNKNVNLNVVGCGKKNGIKQFGKDIHFPLENLFTDPDRFTYNKLGMIRAEGIKGLKGDGKKSQETTSSMFSGMSWSIWKSISRGKQGDYFQNGGI